MKSFYKIIFTVFVLVCMILVSSCIKDTIEKADIPEVTTNDVTNIKATTFTLNGSVTADGGADVTDMGFVYSTTNNPPSVEDASNTIKVTSGSGVGVFSTDITDLTIATTYYVRAYAINSAGVAYGDIKIFSTTTDPLVSVAVRVGNILVYDRNLGAQEEGVALNYTNDTSHSDHSNSSFKGSYYTWDQAKTACPIGWRLPTEDELEAISNAMQFSGKRAYLVGANGTRCYFPLSGHLTRQLYIGGYYWSSTEHDTFEGDAWYLHVNIINGNHTNHFYTPKSYSFSVRCVKTV